jgi:acetyl-CoA carboxylase biotin carboxylase subunit
MFNKVLVANRGAVAARVIRALKQLGVPSVAVYSEADNDLPYLAMADETYSIGPAEASASYLNQEALLDVLKRSKADGLHPGYGFLAENADFARKVISSGACFIGPSPRWIDAMGHKTRARDLMHQHGLSLGASSQLLSDDPLDALKAAAVIGYPVLVKPAAGGGGIGMLPARTAEELVTVVAAAKALAQRSFGNTDLYLERLIEAPRHIEFQILADRYGNVRHLFERDCSVQRRHQKVIEEAPAPLIPRAWIDAEASRLTGILGSLGYDIIGTVETLNDGGASFNFLEMNTRLQVEHAVTEEVTGIDLVTSQIRLACGERLEQVLPASIEISGHAIEARIYAEDPVRFYPSPGLLRRLVWPSNGVRIETGYAQGNRITTHYDPMIAKIIVHAIDRSTAIQRLDEALAETQIEGIKTNIPFVRDVLRDPEFRRGDIDTGIAGRVLKRFA